MEGKRKFILCSAVVLIAAVLCAFGQLDGAQTSNVLTITMVIFGGGNAAEHIAKAWVRNEKS